MFKKISLFLVLTLVIGALSACAPSKQSEKPLTQTKLTEEKKAGIERAYLAYALRPDIVPYNEAKETGKDDFYLGNYNGSELLYLEGYYRAYKDGKFTAPESGAPNGGQIIRGEVTLPMTADEEKLNEIEEAWLKDRMKILETNPEIGKWNWDEKTGCFCYGSSNGYDILYSVGSMSAAVLSSETVADCEFKAGTPFQLLAYKNGVIYELAALYEDGKISKETIEAVAQIHKERFSELYTEA